MCSSDVKSAPLILYRGRPARAISLFLIFFKKYMFFHVSRFYCIMITLDPFTADVAILLKKKKKGWAHVGNGEDLVWTGMMC